MDNLQVDDVITDLHNRRCIVTSLEFTDQPSYPMIPVCYPDLGAFVNLSPRAIWRIERQGVAIYQSDRPQVRQEAAYRNLTLFPALGEGER